MINDNTHPNTNPKNAESRDRLPDDRYLASDYAVSWETVSACYQRSTTERHRTKIYNEIGHTEVRRHRVVATLCINCGNLEISSWCRLQNDNIVIRCSDAVKSQDTFHVEDNKNA